MGQEGGGHIANVLQVIPKMLLFSLMLFFLIKGPYSVQLK